MTYWIYSIPSGYLSNNTQITFTDVNGLCYRGTISTVGNYYQVSVTEKVAAVANPKIDISKLATYSMLEINATGETPQYRYNGSDWVDYTGTITLTGSLNSYLSGRTDTEYSAISIYGGTVIVNSTNGMFRYGIGATTSSTLEKLNIAGGIVKVTVSDTSGFSYCLGGRNGATCNELTISGGTITVDQAISSNKTTITGGTINGIVQGSGKSGVKSMSALALSYDEDAAADDLGFETNDDPVAGAVSAMATSVDDDDIITDYDAYKAQLEKDYAAAYEKAAAEEESEVTTPADEDGEEVLPLWISGLPANYLVEDGELELATSGFEKELGAETGWVDGTHVYGINDVYTDEDGQLTFWMSESVADGQVLLASFDGVDYTGTIKHTDDGHEVVMTPVSATPSTLAATGDSSTPKTAAMVALFAIFAAGVGVFACFRRREGNK